MGLPTGTFQSAYAGRLLVELTARYTASRYNDAGFPNTGASDANIALQAYAGPAGSPTYSVTLDKFNLTVGFEIDYPGGNAGWPVGAAQTAVKNPTTGGIQSWGMADITLTCTLRKK